MPGERRPDPDGQVRAALEEAKRAGPLPWPEAWPLATNGNVCDSYVSARGNRNGAKPDGPEPPGLRPSEGEKRCAGCRYVEGAGGGLARCALYDVPVYPGVLWPHRTGDRHEWQDAILGAEREWRASYEGEPSPYSSLHSVLLAALVSREGIDLNAVTRGDVAA